MTDVERRIRYTERLGLDHAALILKNQVVPLVHETHYHGDGSASDSYYLELNERDFRRLRVYGG